MRDLTRRGLFDLMRGKIEPPEVELEDPKVGELAMHLLGAATTQNRRRVLGMLMSAPFAAQPKGLVQVHGVIHPDGTYQNPLEAAVESEFMRGHIIVERLKEADDFLRRGVPLIPPFSSRIEASIQAYQRAAADVTRFGPFTEADIPRLANTFSNGAPSFGVLAASPHTSAAALFQESHGPGLAELALKMHQAGLPAIKGVGIDNTALARRMNPNRIETDQPLLEGYTEHIQSQPLEALLAQDFCQVNFDSESGQGSISMNLAGLSENRVSLMVGTINQQVIFSKLWELSQGDLECSMSAVSDPSKDKHSAPIDLKIFITVGEGNEGLNELLSASS